MSLLKAVFNAAIAEGLITENPWTGIRRPRTEARTRVVQPEEQPEFLGVCNAAYQRLITVALGTGLREQELLGLRPIDASPAGIHVRSTHAKFGKARLVPLRPEVADAIREQGTTRPCGPTDRLWRQIPSAVQKHIRQACGRARIEPLCMHDLRRTFATRCAMAGMPMAILKDIMGHSSAEITAK